MAFVVHCGLRKSNLYSYKKIRNSLHSFNASDESDLTTTCTLSPDARSSSQIFDIPHVPANLCPDDNRKLQRQHFWPIVQKLIHAEDPGELDRFWAFTSYSRGEIKVPAPVHRLHRPSREYFPDLPQPVPFHHSDSFPELLPLQRNYHTVQEELDRLLTNNHGKCTSMLPHTKLSYLKGWTSLPVIDNGVLLENQSFRTMLPRTLKLLNDLPKTPRGALFAAQEPMTGIGKHSDGRNFLLTAHLGLHVPRSRDLWIEVGGVRSGWREGAWTVLDTSFEHHTWNGTIAKRIVLVVDVWHPALTKIEREAILKLYNLRGVFLEEWDAMERKAQSEANSTDRKERKVFGNWGPKIWA